MKSLLINMWICAVAPIAASAVMAWAPAASEPETDLRAAFDEIHTTVQEQFLDPAMAGVDWPALGAEYRQRIDSETTIDEFGIIVNQMLDALGTSHTHLYTVSDPAYFQLLSIFRAPLDEEIRRAHPDNVALRYPGIGIFTRQIEDQVFVSGVLDGFPAAKAGVRVGDRIIDVDGKPFHPIRSFEGRVDQEVQLCVQRTRASSEPLAIAVTPIMLDPAPLLLSAATESVRVVDRPPHRIGYIHLWSFAGEAYFELLKDELTHGRLRDADAVVVDLRDGWGGANPEYLNLFNRQIPSITYRTRDGEVRVMDSQWRKPVALLVNEGTRSGKEIFAYAFQKHGIGPVVGVCTAGAVVAGRPFLIRPGLLLYLAVMDAQVDGERLEGRGVQPDVTVPFDIRYANGADPQLDAAIERLLSD